jgi:hypothetical protein
MKRALILLALIATCFSTTVIPVTVEELARTSTDVVVGSTGEPRSVWNKAHTMIYTVTPFRIEHALKGNRSGQVNVTQMGGRLDGIETKVAGVKQFSANERDALFLRPSQDMPGTYVITGLMQGRFAITQEGGKEVVSNGVSGVEVFSRTTQQIGGFQGAKMTLQTLEQRVRRAEQK